MEKQLTLWLQTLPCGCQKGELLKKAKLFIGIDNGIVIHDPIKRFLEIVAARDFYKNYRNFLSCIDKNVSYCCEQFGNGGDNDDITEINHLDSAIQGICTQCKYRVICLNHESCPECGSDNLASPYALIDEIDNVGHKLFVNTFISNMMTTNIYKSLKIKSISDDCLEYEVQVVLRGFNSKEISFPNGPNNIILGGDGSVYSINDNMEAPCFCKELTYIFNNHDSHIQRLEQLCILGNYLLLNINYKVSLMQKLNPIEPCSNKKNTKRKREDADFVYLLKIMTKKKGPKELKKLKHLSNSLEVDYFNYNNMDSFGKIGENNIIIAETHQEFYYANQYTFLFPPILINCYKNKVHILSNIENKYNNIIHSNKEKYINSIELHRLLLNSIIELKFDNKSDKYHMINNNLQYILQKVQCEEGSL